MEQTYRTGALRCLVPELGVILTEAVIAALIRMGRFIQRNSPARVATFVAEPERRCLGLATAPHSNPPLPEREATLTP